MTETRPVALVLGATGRQGGSVARHLLAGGRWTVRALTRRPHDDPARTLGALGAEVVAGDLDDAGSLRAACAGADAVFGVTDWWEHFDREADQGRALVDACADAGVRHLVLSTQPSSVAALGGDGLDPFEPKAAVEHHARRRGVPASFVHVAFYWENLLALVVPRSLGHGRFELALPMGAHRLGGVAEDDIGGVVAALLAAGPAPGGRTVPVVGDAQGAATIAAAITRVTGYDVRAASDPAHSPWGRIPGAEALAAALDRTFAVYRALQCRLDDGIAASRALYPPMQDLDRWAASHAAELRWMLAQLAARTAP